MILAAMAGKGGGGSGGGVSVWGGGETAAGTVALEGGGGGQGWEAAVAVAGEGGGLAGCGCGGGVGRATGATSRCFGTQNIQQGQWHIRAPFFLDGYASRSGRGGRKGVAWGGEAAGEVVCLFERKRIEATA